GLWEHVGDTGATFQALWGQWMVTIGRGRVAPARRIGGELLALAGRLNDRSLLLEAHHAMWATSFWLAEFPAAMEHTEKGISLYDRQRHRSLALLYGGRDPAACGRTSSAGTQGCLGRPRQAAAPTDAAIARAEEIPPPPTMAIGLTWACALHYFERDARATRTLARRLVDLAEERDLPA